MAEFGVVIRGGMVIDGTRMPRYRADVGIKDGKVAKIGNLKAHQAKKVVDAGGMLVAPGFVDLHTHYDAQLFWDPYCTISSWHGVTSIVIGNCGFGFAPVKPEMRDRAMLTMMPTERETKEMQRMIHEAMDHGACGWSAQRFGENSVQADYDGSPMVTDLMHDETALELAKILGERNEGFIQMSYIPNSSQYEGDAQDHTEKHFEELAIAAGRPILYNAIAINDAYPERFRRQLHWIESCAKRGIRVFGQSATLELGFLFTFKDWNLWDDMPAWREVTTGPVEDRLIKLSDPERRPGLRKVDEMTGLITNSVRGIFVLECKRTDLKKYENMTVGEVADKEHKHPVDAMLDIACADGLNTEFYTPPVNLRNDYLKEMVTSDGMAIFGVSDGGAHTKFFAGGRYATEALIKMGRDNDILSLEELHFRLSNHPAMCAGFKNRGTLVEGNWADVVVYDLDKLAIKPLEIVHDFPGGEWRRVQRAEGYHTIMVNGEVTFEDGQGTGAVSGRLLRRCG